MYQYNRKGFVISGTDISVELLKAYKKNNVDFFITYKAIDDNELFVKIEQDYKIVYNNDLIIIKL